MAVPEEFKTESKYLSPLKLSSAKKAAAEQNQNLPSFRKASPRAQRGYMSPFDKFIKE